MIRNLLATTALATLVATAAYAQQQPAPAATDTTQPAATTPAQPPAPVKAEGYLAANLIGETVYNGTGENAENIGDVNDILLDQNGKTKSVILGVGGFLGMGEHNVAVPFDKLTLVEQNGDRWFVYPSTKEQLEALPEFDRKPYEPAATTTASTSTDNTGAASTTTVQPAAPAATDQKAAQTTTEQPAATDTTKTASIDKSTLTKVPPEKLLTDKDLVGTTVYGANDENIGEINDVVLAQDGKVDAVIIDVGGFLGIGEKSVAVGYDKLSFMADKNGKKYLYTPFTKDQLKAQPAFDKQSFADNRDKQLMKVE